MENAHTVLITIIQTPSILSFTSRSVPLGAVKVSEAEVHLNLVLLLEYLQPLLYSTSIFDRQMTKCRDLL